MRWMPLLVVAAACGAPELTEEQPTVEVTGAATAQLGDARCSGGTCRLAAPLPGARVPLRITGPFELDRVLTLPPSGELVAIDVGERSVELKLVDERAPAGVHLDGLRLHNFGSRPVLAYGGCALLEVQPGAQATLDCMNDGLVAVQRSEVVEGVTVTTTHGLWAQ